ncbi:peptidoglycan DD-metalloendopeptidase family protein [Cutibacterium sp. WCA-380-WT-3A]|uniref:Peptidoglycan DD-metalloendopeptidase family protein n=1 Tax=Cutibacterium porci TaxID=2605781 RepID=A0A7K0J9H7_9ACTN|nr:peptidoglycan DD-metalloendopeptidase family protein [Cutibacterium porci]MSS46520.1 peptidoglycan DD-metalloendopeptidase family protein [Cutibacterium porci]
MRRSACISLLIIVVGTCLLVLPAPSRSVAAPPARSVTNRPTPPVPGPVIKGFAPPVERWLPGSRGIEFAATVGEPVTTVTAGVVVFAGQVAGAGVVSVMLPDGRRTTHMPVVPSVAVGQVVVPGQVIGVVGMGPPCTRICLHWGLKKGDEYQNPMTLLQRQVRLLPLKDRPHSTSGRRPLMRPVTLPGSSGKRPGSVMPPWRGAGKEFAAAVDDVIADVISDGSSAGMGLTKSGTQPFCGDVGVNLRSG